MFRVNKKSMSGLMFLVAMSVAACNNVTGPTGPGTAAPIDRGPRETPVFDKLCIDDLRAVAITTPSESRIVHVDDFLMITWEAQHVCGSYGAQVEVSYNGGNSFELLGQSKNSLSMSWRVADREGASVAIRVSLQDANGELSDQVNLAGTVQRRAGQGPDRDPEETD